MRDRLIFLQLLEGRKNKTSLNPLKCQELKAPLFRIWDRAKEALIEIGTPIPSGEPAVGVSGCANAEMRATCRRNSLLPEILLYADPMKLGSWIDWLPQTLAIDKFISEIALK